jgi:integrase
MTEENKTKKESKCLTLSPVLDKEGLFTGTKSDGKTYSVRKDRHRYYFPEEWIRFINSIKEDKKILFETLLQTGARIEEALNIRPKDFDWERNTLRLFVTKSKSKKGESIEMGGASRGFCISSEYCRKVRKYIKENNIKDDERLFNLTKQAVWQMQKRILKKINIKDWYNFSLHNIRKTNGMWLKSLIPYSREITEGEICMRLGHDMNTFLKHYGSPSIFNERDKNMMIKILGDIYGLR